jgi:hypothetical protein
MKHSINQDDQKVIKFVRDCMYIIQKETGLSDYSLSVVLSKSNIGSNGNIPYAEIGVDYEYLRATITIYPDLLRLFYNKDFDSVIKVLCHEASHMRLTNLELMARDRWADMDALKTEIERITEVHGRLVYKSMSLENKFKDLKLNGTTKSKTNRKRGRHNKATPKGDSRKSTQ